MKLLRCDECEDIFSLKLKYRHCACQKSGGRYIDLVKVEVAGPCRVFGVDNDFWLYSNSYPRGEIFLIKEPNKAIIRICNSRVSSCLDEIKRLEGAER